MGDQPVARPLPTHRTTQTRNKKHTDIRALSGIRTHDASVRAGDDSSCLRPRSDCDRLNNLLSVVKSKIIVNYIGIEALTEVTMENFMS
jgi:hypothetical protein